MDVNTKQLREYLIEKYNVEALSTFLFDYFPQVYNEITPEMRQGKRIQLLLEHCRNCGRFFDLLANLERERPGSFNPQGFSKTPFPKMALDPPNSVTQQRNQRQIFISHAHQDAVFAKRLARDLKKQGWEIWIAPDSILPGEKWVEAINRGLAESGVFLLVLTEAAVSSRWVRSETNVAIGMEHRGELHFLPLKLETVTVPPLWQEYQWIPVQNECKKNLELLLQVLTDQKNVDLNRIEEHKPHKDPSTEIDQPLKRIEIDVLNCLVRGAANNEIALELKIVPNSVEDHIESIFKKLGAQTRSDATRIAHEKGLVSLINQATELDGMPELELTVDRKEKDNKKTPLTQIPLPQQTLLLM
ncbi:MAG: TIR domain-containing protein [Chloroflexi bacterium]|nr:MAG: TIR domain-containing protein [Chloroflexota bacterium]